MPTLPNDQVIEDGNIQQSARRDYLGRKRNVRSRGCRVSRRVIVNQNQAYGIGPHRFPKEFRYPHGSLIHAALVDLPGTNDAIFGIEQHYPELLLLQPRELVADEVNHVFRTRYGRSLFDRQSCDSTADLQCCLQRGGFCWTNSGQQSKSGRLIPVIVADCTMMPLHCRRLRGCRYEMQGSFPLKSSMPHDIPEWLAAMPKVELHVHLEGTISPATLQLLSERNDIGDMTPERIAGMYAYHDFPGFIDAFTAISDSIKTADDLGLVVLEYGRQLAAQNVIYAEIHYNPEPHRRRKHIPMADGLAAMNRARQQVRDALGVEIRWITDGVRDAYSGPSSVDITIDWIQEAGLDSGIVALGLGGNEINFPPDLFRDSFRRARELGINVTAHAGEAVGPESIWSTIRELGVVRIGHGISAAHDPVLMNYLAENRIPLEVCPSSNVRTGVIPALDDVPLSLFERYGVRFSVSSDDPPLFGTTVTQEYDHMRRLLNWDRDRMNLQVAEIVDQSFAEPELKRTLHQRLSDHATVIRPARPLH